MGINALKEDLQERVGDRFRGLFKYDSTALEVIYLRDDLKKKRQERQFRRMLQRIQREATSAEQNAFPLGDLHATLRYFDEAIVLHLPTSQHGGVVVSLEPNVARQFNSFVNTCIQQLHSFPRGGDESDELP